MMMIVHIFLLNIVINTRQQCHCHDRPIILWRPCVFGILLTGSPPPPWAHFQHILDLLTKNYSHRKPNDKAVISDWLGWLWRWWIFETSQKSVNMLSILQGQKGVLEMSIRGHQDVFEVKQNTNFLQSNETTLYFQISPPIIEQFGQFVLSVKNRKKLDAEKLSKLELQVADQKNICWFSSARPLKKRN